MNLFGPITSETVGEIAAAIAEAKAAGRDSLEIAICSDGGDAIAGLAVFDLLRGSGLTVKTEALGIVASAAATIYLAGDVRAIHPSALIMLHPAWVSMSGNADELRKSAAVLDKISARMTEIAGSVSSSSESVILGMKSGEVWLSASEAIACGISTETTAAEYAAQLEIQRMSMGIKFLSFLCGKSESEIRAEVKAELKAELTAEEAAALEALKAEKAEKEAELAGIAAKLAELEAKMGEAEAAHAAEMKEQEEAAQARAEVVAAMRDGLTLAAAEKAIQAKRAVDIRAAIQSGEKLPQKQQIPGGKAPSEILAEYQGMTDPVKRGEYFAKHKNEIAQALKK